jgi:hypothetical protein
VRFEGGIALDEPSVVELVNQRLRDPVQAATCPQASLSTVRALISSSYLLTVHDVLKPDTSHATSDEQRPPAEQLEAVPSFPDGV